MSEFICPICKREIPDKYIEKHHLVPKSKKGKEFILVCINCGDMLHQLIDNKDMAKNFNNLGVILTRDDVQKYVNWVQKRPNNFSVTMATKKKR